MAGCPPVLSLRQQIEIGATLGPRIFTTGPVLEGKAALTADLAPTSAGAALVAAGPSQAQAFFLETGDGAAAEVEREKAESYDAVKVNTLLPATAFEAVVRTAREVGLPVYGHVPRSVGLSGALSAGMRSIEHLTGYIEQRTLRSGIHHSLCRIHGWRNTRMLRSYALWRRPRAPLQSGTARRS